MARTVTIPNNHTPNYSVWVNGVKHTYPAGETVEVPDGVADAIENYYEGLPKEDPRKGGMIINKVVKVIPEESRYLPELSSSGGSITDKAFAESLWEKRKIAKFSNPFNPDDICYLWSGDVDASWVVEGVKGFTTNGGQVVRIHPDGLIQYQFEMGGGGGTILIPEHEDVTIETKTPSTPFTTFFAYETDGNETQEEAEVKWRFYIDEEKTIVARREDAVKAWKHGNIMVEVEQKDGVKKECAAMMTDYCSDVEIVAWCDNGEVYFSSAETEFEWG